MTRTLGVTGQPTQRPGPASDHAGALTLCAGVAIGMFWTAFALARIIASARREPVRAGEN